MIGNNRLRVITWLTLAALCALLGCGRPAHSKAATKSGQVDDIERALRRAEAFLLKQQSSDGAWRSDAYAPFREGDALTPIALLALQSLPRAQRPWPAIDRGIEYLEGLVDSEGNVRTPSAGIAYPVYTAAGTLLVISARQNAASLRAREAWLGYLRDRQLTERNGWNPEDRFYGGWGYAPDIPRKLQNAAEISPLVEPNISATVFALDALRAAGVDSSASEIQKALRFVERCQNYAAEGAKLTKFDDGGFHFLQTDPFRNKAGMSGRDEQGRERFASYGSATADGLRALLLCGETAESPRVRAAFLWLRHNFAAKHQPGSFNVEAARDSVYFYYCRSLALLLDRYPTPCESNAIPRVQWATELARVLQERQLPFGGWRNSDVEVREDDPLVATSLAVTALAACGRIIRTEPSSE